MPADRQAQWIDWIERAQGRRREARIDEAVGRLSPTAVAAQEEVTQRVAPPPERNWWIWLLLLLLLVVAGLLLWFFLVRGGGKRTVPKVVGLRSSTAAQRLHDKGLDVVPTTGASARPVGVVFAQRPGAGAQVDKGANVTILISGGLARKPVPNVTDLPVAQAQQQLTSSGFKTVVKHVASTRQAGVVTNQDPAPGLTAVKGASVTLSVSSGQKPIVVPSLVGSQQGAAVTTLTKLGLSPQLQNVGSIQPAGQIVSQKPPAGTQVDKGSAVVLTVSKGSAAGTTTTQTTTAPTTTQVTTTGATSRTGTTAATHVSVPAVRGLAVTAGLRRLNTAGLRPVVRYVPSSSRAGIIVTQSPTGTAARGSSVRIAISEGPSPGAPTSLPSVVGQDQASAAQALNQAGFKPVVLFRKTADQSKDGNVIEQQPASGSSIPAGSYVAIFVGRS
jgi:serine/threonine-protein kinase